MYALYVRVDKKPKYKGTPQFKTVVTHNLITVVSRYLLKSEADKSAIVGYSSLQIFG